MFFLLYYIRLPEAGLGPRTLGLIRSVGTLISRHPTPLLADRLDRAPHMRWVQRAVLGLLVLSQAVCSSDTGPVEPPDEEAFVQQVLVSPTEVNLNEGETVALDVTVVMSDGTRHTNPVGALQPR